VRHCYGTQVAASPQNIQIRATPARRADTPAATPIGGSAPAYQWHRDAPGTAEQAPIRPHVCALLELKRDRPHLQSGRDGTGSRRVAVKLQM